MSEYPEELARFLAELDETLHFCLSSFFTTLLHFVTLHPFKGHLSREKTISGTRKCDFLVDAFLKLSSSLPLP